MKDRVILRGLGGQELILTSWMDASHFQRACALDRHEASRIFTRLVATDPHAFELHRPRILALADMASTGATNRTNAELWHRLSEHLLRGSGLILVDEGLHHPPCGLGPQPQSHTDTEGNGKSEWSGDSARWSQEKKLRSMHPDLRPLVQGVLDGLTARGFQPKIFFGWRSVTVQLEIYKKGNSGVKFSFHNVQKKDGTPNAHAADIIDKRWAWSAAAAKNGFWAALGEEAKKQNLYWGGDWKKPDWAHVQLVPNSQLKLKKKESGL